MFVPSLSWQMLALRLGKLQQQQQQQQQQLLKRRFFLCDHSGGAQECSEANDIMVWDADKQLEARRLPAANTTYHALFFDETATAVSVAGAPSYQLGALVLEQSRVDPVLGDVNRFRVVWITPRTAPCCHRELLLVVLVLLLLVSLHPPQWTYQRVCRCAAMPKPDCRLRSEWHGIVWHGSCGARRQPSLRHRGSSRCSWSSRRQKQTGAAVRRRNVFPSSIASSY
jgi:hypothetical protein